MTKEKKKVETVCKAYKELNEKQRHEAFTIARKHGLPNCLGLSFYIQGEKLTGDFLDPKALSHGLRF